MSATSATQAGQVKRVRFVAAAEGRGEALRRFADPGPAAVCAVAETLSPEVAVEAGSGELAVLLVAAEGPAKPAWRERAEKWIGEARDPEAGERGAVRIELERGLVAWRPGRLAIVAPARALDGIFAAAVDFAFYEQELRMIEAELAADWKLVERDVAMVHDVSREDLKRAGEIGQITRRAMLRRMRYARIEPHLLATPRDLPDSARRIARGLRKLARVESRLEAADGQIEVYEDIYDMANQRMSEYSNFIREYRMELIIVLLLLGELIAILVDLGWRYFAP